MKVTIDIFNGYNLYLEADPAEIDLLNKLISRARNYGGYGDTMHLDGNRPACGIRVLAADFNMPPPPAPAEPTAE